MINFQGVRGGVGYNDTAGDADSLRRQQLAQLMLRQSEATPAVGVTGALNKILSGAIAGWQMGKDSEEQKARGEAKNATLADALRAGQGQAAETKAYGDGTTINWDGRKGDQGRMAEILAGNRDTAPMGMQMQIGQMDAKAKREADMADALFKQKLDQENERLKWRDVSDGKQWFVPDGPGQTPASAPMVQPAPAPQAGPDPSTAPVAATAPPTPLASASGSGRMEPKSNNPGNIRTSANNDWQGKSTPQGAQFEAFDTPENGIRAMGVLLGNYAKQGTNTLRGIVGKWAPPNENQTDALAVNAARRTGLDLDQPLDLNDPAIRSKVVNALIQQEQGGMPYSPGQVQAGVDASLNRTAQPPAAPPQVQAAGAPQASPGPQRMVVGGMPGTVVGGQGGPKFRPATPDDLSRNGLSPGTAAQVDRNGQIHVLQKAGEGGGGPFGGSGENPAVRNLYVKLQTKQANGESLTPQEQLAMAMIQQDAEKPRMMMTDQGLTNIPGMPLPTMPGRQAPAAAQPPAQAAPTDTVPNPMAPPAPAPAPAPAPPPQPTVIVPKVEKPSNEQNLNAGFANRLDAAQNTLDKLDAQGYDAPSLADRALDKVPGVSGYLTSNQFQKLEQAQREFITAQLRRESGAAISQSEFDEAKKLYFPQPGEGPDIIADKRRSREMAIRNMAQSAGPAKLGFTPKPAPKEGDQPEPRKQPAAERAGDIPTFSDPTDAALAALPSGAQFRDPNGVLRRKP